jgi:hypothetical protein
VRDNYANRSWPCALKDQSPPHPIRAAESLLERPVPLRGRPAAVRSWRANVKIPAGRHQISPSALIAMIVLTGVGAGVGGASLALPLHFIQHIAPELQRQRRDRSRELSAGRRRFATDATRVGVGDMRPCLAAEDRRIVVACGRTRVSPPSTAS